MLQGSMVALVTPFNEGTVDRAALRRLVQFQEEAGTDFIVPCGTTGESATLAYEEHETVVETVVDAVNSSRVLAGTGSNSTREAIRLTRHAQETGCDYALVITPYYNCPPQRGLYQHYRRIAESVDIGIVLYNVPSRTGVNLQPDTVIKLSEIPNIVGIKEASGELNQISRIVKETPAEFAVLSGDDSCTLPILSVGGQGVVSVLANLLPGPVKQLVDAWQQGQLETAREIHQELLPLTEAMFWDTNPIPVKTALSLMGYCRSELRLPLVEMADDQREKLSRLLKQQGVL